MGKRDDSECKPALCTMAKHRKVFWGRKAEKKMHFPINCNNIITISVLINGASRPCNNILGFNE